MTGTLHNANCDEFIFAPNVGLHEDVHELDFSSLYPNIDCPESLIVRYENHRDRDGISGLDYATCDGRGYLVNVLQPISH